MSQIARRIFRYYFHLPRRKPTWQWKVRHLKMYLLLKMVIFQCHLSFQRCTVYIKQSYWDVSFGTVNGWWISPTGVAKKPLEMAGTLTGRKTLSREVEVRLLWRWFQQNLLFVDPRTWGILLPRFDLHMFFFQMGFFPPKVCR